MKFYGELGCGLETNWLHFGDDLHHYPDLGVRSRSWSGCSQLHCKNHSAIILLCWRSAEVSAVWVLLVFIFLIVCWCQKCVRKNPKTLHANILLLCTDRTCEKGPWNYHEIRKLSVNFPCNLTCFQKALVKFRVFLHEWGWPLTVGPVSHCRLPSVS